MKRSELRQIIEEEVCNINEANDPKIDIQTAAKLFDAKTKNEFKLSKYKWSGDSVKLNPKDFGLWGQLLNSISLDIWQKGITKEDDYSFYNFHLTWQYKSRGSNGTGIGTVFINNKNLKDVKVRLEDGRYFK